jgi:hypothetical protein
LPKDAYEERPFIEHDRRLSLMINTHLINMDGDNEGEQKRLLGGVF